MFNKIVISCCVALIALYLHDRTAPRRPPRFARPRKFKQYPGVFPYEQFRARRVQQELRKYK